MAKKTIGQFMQANCKTAPCKICSSPDAVVTITEMLQWMDQHRKIVAIDKIRQFIAENHDVVVGLSQFRRHLLDNHNAEHSKLWLAVRRMR